MGTSPANITDAPASPSQTAIAATVIVVFVGIGSFIAWRLMCGTDRDELRRQQPFDLNGDAPEGPGGEGDTLLGVEPDPRPDYQ
jgi:hypothetical protein